LQPDRCSCNRLHKRIRQAAELKQGENSRDFGCNETTSQRSASGAGQLGRIELPVTPCGYPNHAIDPTRCTKSIQIKSTHDAWRTKIMLPAKVPILSARQGGLLVTCVTVAPLRVNV
jgi:hypothetical protein